MTMVFSTRDWFSVAPHREPEPEPPPVAEPVPAGGWPEGHERGLDTGHVPQLQRDDGDDGDEQLPVGVDHAELLQPARRGGGQRGRVADVERRALARRQGVAHAVPLRQHGPGESSFRARTREIRPRSLKALRSGRDGSTDRLGETLTDRFRPQMRS